MHYHRRLTLSGLNSSAFIFGPRMTGKTTLLREMACDSFFDLLDPELELQFSSQPRNFFEQLEALNPSSTVIIDEIQKVPSLLNYVQMAIDRFSHKVIMSGSSARKLKRGGANLLGGRALDLRLHPLTCNELGALFSIEAALQQGTLPKVAVMQAEERDDEVRLYLKSYVTTYIKEEIQAEALTRNIGSFQRFLAIAAQSNAQVIEFANISRESSVPASTVKEYYQILEDTHLGFFLWPCDRNERKKARPKFYFFDCGVIRALQNRLVDPPVPAELGFLFENWMVNEFRRINDYLNKDLSLSFWRYRNHEIDIILSDGHGPVLAVECKSGSAELSPAVTAAFRERFPGVPLLIASLRDTRPRMVNGIEILPWKEVVERFTKW